jgi:hypothetical protein
MWKHFEEPDKPQMTIWRMRIASWVTKATNTYTGCVIIIACPLQRWLHKRALVLRYMHIVCLFYKSNVTFPVKQMWLLLTTAMTVLLEVGGKI